MTAIDPSMAAYPDLAGHTAPEPADRRAEVPAADRRTAHIIAAFFGFAIITMKVAPHMANTAPQTALPQLYILLLVLLIRRGAYFSFNRLILYVLFIGTAAVANLLSGPLTELPSFFFVVAIYFAYTVEIKMSREGFLYYLKIIQWFGLAAAGFVYLDWAFQLAHLEMPNLEKIIPPSWLFFNYIYIQPLEWGNRFMKPNGLFFLEASYVSQFLAFCLIFEVSFFRRITFMVPLSTGLVASFGGTGMLLFVLTLPVIIFYFRLKLIPLVLIATPAVGVAAVQLGVLDNAIERSTEFDKQGSSGNIRFTNQWVTLQDVLTGDPRQALIGHGAGVMPRRLNMLFTPLTKVAFEYGFITYMFWAIFMIYCVFGRGVPFVVSWAMFMQYLFLNGSFLVPINNYYVVVLAALFRITGEKKWSSFSDLLLYLRLGRSAPPNPYRSRPALGYSPRSAPAETR